MSAQELAWRAAHHQAWHETIGDGGVVAWIITAAYLIAALLCLRASSARVVGNRRERRFWVCAAVVLLALGLNKQLDLQIALIDWGRAIALENGWYGERRTAQRSGFAIALLVAGIGAASLLPMVRRAGSEVRLAFVGLLAIGTYVAVRAAQFEHIFTTDQRVSEGPGWLSALELAGTALVAFAAWRRRRSRGG